MRATSLIASLSVLFALTSAQAAAEVVADQVRSAEQSFAGTMAARDHAAFSRHIAEDAVFFDGEKAIRGKAAVVAAWKAFFERANAPFSWAPESVEVLDSGTLAHSSGPVLDPAGKRVGTFNSVWRLEPDGVWRVVFDKGCNVCNCAKDAAPASD
jgi:ketosteroid isomerase-like protein